MLNYTFKEHLGNNNCTTTISHKLSNHPPFANLISDTQVALAYSRQTRAALPQFHQPTYDMLVHCPRAEPICSRTLSSHCSGPFRCISIQQGVLVIVWRLQRAKLALTLTYKSTTVSTINSNFLSNTNQSDGQYTL